MKKFLKSLWVYFQLYKAGFFFSSNTCRDYSEKYIGKHDTLWGFFRLNYEKDEKKEYAIVDIDFNEEKFYHVHQGDEKSLFRVDF